MPRQGGPGGAGLRPHQPGADRCRRSCCARSGTAPVPQRQSHAQPLLEAAEPGQARARRAGRRTARARRVIRPSCCSSGKAGRPQCLPGLRAGPAGSPSSPARARPPPRRAGRTRLPPRAGHPHHEPSEPADRPSPAPARAIWSCRHATGDPGFLAAQAIGLFLWAGQLNGTAAKPRRPGRGHPGLPPGGHRRRPRRGGRGRRRNSGS